MDEDCYLKLITTSKVACLIGGYNVHSHQFGMGTTVGNKKMHDLLQNKLKDEQARLKNLKIIFIDEYSMLRQKVLFYIWERWKEIKGNSFVFSGLCVVLVGDPIQLSPVLADSLLVESLRSTRREDVNGNILYIGSSVT